MTTSKLLRFTLALAIILASAFAYAADENARRRNILPSRRAFCACCRKIPSPSIRSIPPHGKLAYTATAGTLRFFDQSGEQSAAVFYTAYVVKGGGAKRPLTFVFNGGPGAASAFLHLGLVGPRILDLGPGARDFARAQLRDNPDTWLRFTDLVMIDPIGTGWSRTAKPDDGKNFWNVDSDASSMAKAIALYVDHNNRFDFAEISVRRELWRLPRRQDRARDAARARDCQPPAS